MKGHWENKSFNKSDRKIDKKVWPWYKNKNSISTVNFEMVPRNIILTIHMSNKQRNHSTPVLKR